MTTDSNSIESELKLLKKSSVSNLSKYFVKKNMLHSLIFKGTKMIIATV